MKSAIQTCLLAASFTLAGWAYAEVAAPDAITRQLEGYVPHWRSTVGRDDDEVAETIRSDGIDILVSVAGHQANALYYGSATFKRLDKATQSWRRRALDTMCEKHAEKPVARMEARHVRALRGWPTGWQRERKRGRTDFPCCTANGSQ